MGQQRVEVTVLDVEFIVLLDEGNSFGHIHLEDDCFLMVQLYLSDGYKQKTEIGLARDSPLLY